MGGRGSTHTCTRLVTRTHTRSARSKPDSFRVVHKLSFGVPRYYLMYIQNGGGVAHAGVRYVRQCDAQKSRPRWLKAQKDALILPACASCRSRHHPLSIRPSAIQPRREGVPTTFYHLRNPFCPSVLQNTNRYVVSADKSFQEVLLQSLLGGETREGPFALLLSPRGPSLYHPHQQRQAPALHPWWSGLRQW